MEFVSTFDKHRNETNVSLYEYVRSKRLELGKIVLSQKIVYLDTKFWILLRDAQRGSAKTPISKTFLDTVIRLSATGKYIFPISEDIFLEVIKQTDQRSLNATVI